MGRASFKPVPLWQGRLFRQPPLESPLDFAFARTTGIPAAAATVEYHDQCPQIADVPSCERFCLRRRKVPSVAAICAMSSDAFIREGLGHQRNEFA